MKFATVCSGIEAPSVAWHPMGWRAQFVSEIEPFPCRVLADRWPDVPNLGDMTKFHDWPEHSVDLLCGGTPCQSFSVAGLRKGLADPRGNLMLTYLAIAARYRPRWLVWENVPGVLSSNEGRDFGTLLGGLGQLGYGFAYRVLDAQYVRVESHARAVPQRRRRVFVVGHLGDWRRAAAVLFERESLRGDSPPRREAGKGVAGTISSRTQGGGGLGTDFELGGGLIADVAPTLNAHFGDKQGLEDQHINGGAGLFVAHSLRAEGFDASEDGTGRGTPLVPIAFSSKDHGGDAAYGVSPTLRAGGHSESHANAGVMPAIAIRTAQTSANGHGVSMGAAHTLDGANGQAVAFDQRGREGGSQFEGPHETANIRAASGGSSRSFVAQEWAVRRLTPRECERLQGFPDDYTAIKGAKDGPRYKALGNSMAVNVMRWVGERIAAVDAL